MSFAELLGRQSLPAWGVWIEMFTETANMVAKLVAPRMGSVD